MADLGTLALGTFTNVSSTAITGAEPVLQAIASANDATDVHDTQNGTHVGEASFALGDVPADLGNIDTLFVRLRYAWQSGTRVNTWNALRARVFKSDGTTPLTNEATLASSITTTTPTNSSVIQFTGVDTAATKDDWNGAVVRVYFDISKVKGGDSLEERVFAAEVTGTYTAAVAGIVGTLNRALPLTLVAAATALVQGALSKIVGLALVAAGAVAVQGAMAKPLPLALSAQGTVAVQGTLGKPVPLTLSAVGSVAAPGVNGTLSRQVPLALNADGDVLTVGALARPLPLTLSANGDVAIVGALARPLPLALSAQGAVPGAGTVNTSLALTLVADGDVLVVGVATRLLPLTVSAQGTVGAGGGAPPNLPRTKHDLAVALRFGL